MTLHLLYHCFRMKVMVYLEQKVFSFIIPIDYFGQTKAPAPSGCRCFTTFSVGSAYCFTAQ